MSENEIDFLPQWYKSGRRQQVRYQTQYVALGGVLVVMIVWNFVAAHSISKDEAQFAQMATRQAEAQSLSAKSAELKSELGRLQKKAESIKEIDSKIDVASVLAEMSFLIDEKIVISKVEFVAEEFLDKQKTRPFPGAGTVVKAAWAESGEKQELPLGDVRFRVVICGIAANGSDVTALICKLEDSPYFCRIVPSFFSRPTEIKAESDLLPYSRAGLAGRTPNGKWPGPEGRSNIQVSEFEISCYLANYREL
jgi:hypothetical protein